MVISELALSAHFALLTLQDLLSQIIEIKDFTVSADVVASRYSIDTSSDMKSKNSDFRGGKFFPSS
jgi:hypothetical protein